MKTFKPFGPMARFHLESAGQGAPQHLTVACVVDMATSSLAPGIVARGGVAAFRRAAVEKLVDSPASRLRLEWNPRTEDPEWVEDPQFCVDYHLRKVKLPLPGGSDALKELTRWIDSQPLDSRSPMWELWMVSGLGPRRFGMVAKVHMAMLADWPGCDPLSVLFDDPEEGVHVEPVGGGLLAGSEESGGGFRGWFSRSMGSVWRSPAPVAEPSEAETRHDATLGQLGWQPTAPFNAQVSGGGELEWRLVSGEHIDALAAKLGGGTREVLLAAIAGGVGSYRKAQEKQKKMASTLPVWTSDGGVGSQGDSAGTGRTARYGAEEDSEVTRREQPFRVLSMGGVQLGRVPRAVPASTAMLMEIPVDLDDPVQRYHTTCRIRRSASVRSASAKAAAAVKTPDGTDAHRLPGSAGSSTASGRRRIAIREELEVLVSRPDAYQTVVTHLAGPRLGASLEGCRLAAVYPVAPASSDHAFTVVSIRYGEFIGWGFRGVPDLMPDWRDLVARIERAFFELLEQAEAPEIDTEAWGAMYGTQPLSATG